jgi:hypothetical protein
MKKGRVLCLSGICMIAVAFVLALSGAHACTVLDPTELADIYGGECDLRCVYWRYHPGCAPEEVTGPCEVQEYQGEPYCPWEEWRESCEVDQYHCTDEGIYEECTESYEDCPGWYRFYYCERENTPEFSCWWRQGNLYPCYDRDPDTWQNCDAHN